MEKNAAVVWAKRVCKIVRKLQEKRFKHAGKNRGTKEVGRRRNSDEVWISYGCTYEDTAFWDATPCSLVDVYGCFRGSAAIGWTAGSSERSAHIQENFYLLSSIGFSFYVY